MSVKDENLELTAMRELLRIKSLETTRLECDRMVLEMKLEKIKSDNSKLKEENARLRREVESSSKDVLSMARDGLQEVKHDKSNIKPGSVKHIKREADADVIELTDSENDAMAKQNSNRTAVNANPRAQDTPNTRSKQSKVTTAHATTSTRTNLNSSNLPSTSNAISKTPVNSDTKNEPIQVMIKSEDGHERVEFVTITKSEDGKIVSWDLEQFDLGPTIPVQAKYNQGFGRMPINNAFNGGNPQSCFLNWQGKSAPGPPYMAFNREWNPHLPDSLGKHGVILTGRDFRMFRDGTRVTKPIPLMVREGVNDWRYLGDYKIAHWGDVSSTHVRLLPRYTIRAWCEGIIKSGWGKRLVSKHNVDIESNARECGMPNPELIQLSHEGLERALNTGQLVIQFVIVECMGFQERYFREIAHYSAHPKSMAGEKRKAEREEKMESVGVERVKRAKGPKKRLVVTPVKSEDERDDTHNDDSDEEYADS